MSKRKRIEHVIEVEGYAPFLVQASYLLREGRATGWIALGAYEELSEAEAKEAELATSRAVTPRPDAEGKPMIDVGFLGDPLHSSEATVTRVISLSELLLEGPEATHEAHLYLMTSDHQWVARPWRQLREDTSSSEQQTGSASSSSGSDDESSPQRMVGGIDRAGTFRAGPRRRSSKRGDAPRAHSNDAKNARDAGQRPGHGHRRLHSHVDDEE